MHNMKLQSVQTDDIFSIRQQTEPQWHKSALMFPGDQTLLSDWKRTASARMQFVIAVAKKSAPHVTVKQTRLMPLMHTVCQPEALTQ